MEIPGYAIVRQLGVSDMATVYLATQGRLNRPVALKVLHPTLAAHEDFTRRFLHEGRVIDLLRHPQIVPLFEFNFHEPYHYFSMEFLPGGTLEQHIQRGLIPERALFIIRLIAGALAYAHQHGVIHRDLKPRNILFRQDNTPVLTDFGIAKVMDGSATLTVRSLTVHQLRYLSPEHAAGKPLDGRSDLYSLGAIFYETLTGQHPYPANDLIDLLDMQGAIPELPRELEAFQPVLNQLLAKKPEDRFNHAEQLIEALAQLETAPSFRLRDSQKPTLPFSSAQPGILEPSPSITVIPEPPLPKAEVSQPPPVLTETTKPPRSKAVWMIGGSSLFLMAATLGAYLTFFRPPAPQFAPPPMPQSPRLDPDAAQRQAQDLARQRMIEERLQRSVEEEAKRQALEAERLHQIEEEAKRQAAETERLRKIEEEAKRQAAETERLRKIEEDAKRQALEAERLRKIEEQAKRPPVKPPAPEPEKSPAIAPAPRKTPAVAKPAEPVRSPATAEVQRKPAVAENRPDKTSQSRRCGNLLSRITLGEPVSNEDRIFLTKECR